MTKDERNALDVIVTLALTEISTGVSLVRMATPHATDVMAIHGLQRADVLFALADATRCRRLRAGRYRVSSEIDGAAWRLVVEVDPECVVVTLFEVAE